jgi:hypothetical protein
MELWRALMIPTTGGSLDDNGFGVIVSSDPNPRTLSSSITRTIGIAILKAKLLSKSFKREGIPQFYHLLNFICRRSIIFRMESSRSFVSSEVIGSWMSLENISSFRKTLFTVMFKPKSLRVCIRFKSILETNGLPLSLINYQNGSPQIPNTGFRCIDIAFIQDRVIDLVAFTNYHLKGCVEGGF